MALLAGFGGIFLPWKMGIEYLDAFVLLPCSLVSVLWISASLPVRRVWRASAAAAGYGASTLAAGILVVNAGFWNGGPIVPPLSIVASAFALSFSVAAFAAAVAVALEAKNYTTQEAASRLRFGLLVLLGIWVFRSWAPSSVRELVAPLTTTSGVVLLTLGVCIVLLVSAAVMSRPNHGGVVH